MGFHQYTKIFWLEFHLEGNILVVLLIISLTLIWISSAEYESKFVLLACNS